MNKTLVYFSVIFFIDTKYICIIVNYNRAQIVDKAMIRRFTGFLTLCLLVITNVEARTQDVSISQFMANPLFTNPAFAGSYSGLRATIMYRNQWPGNPYINFESVSASFDKSFESINSGFGASYITTRVGGDALISNTMSAYYAYQIQPSEQIQINLGVKGSYFQNQLNWTRVSVSTVYDTIRSMIGFGVGAPYYSSIDNYDIGLGISFTFKDDFIGGFSLEHINSPGISFYKDDTTSLQIKTSFFAAANINAGGNNYIPLIITPSIYYQGRTGFQQFSFGTNIRLGSIFAGAWYRLDFNHTDDVVALIGAQYKQLNLGYSFDFSLLPYGNFNGGAHELTLSYQINKYQNSESVKRGRIQSPGF